MYMRYAQAWSKQNLSGAECKANLTVSEPHINWATKQFVGYAHSLLVLTQPFMQQYVNRGSEGMLPQKIWNFRPSNPSEVFPD